MSMTFFLLQLIAAFMTSCQADSDAAVPVPMKGQALLQTSLERSSLHISESTDYLAPSGFFEQLGLNCVVFGALTEAIVALIIFGAAATISSGYRKRNSKGAHLQKTSKLATQRATSSAGLQRADPTHNRPTGSRSTRPTRDRRLLTCPSPTDKPSKESVLRAQTDGLANAVRGGRASQLPQLLDGAIARALAAASEKTTEQEVVTALLHTSLKACAANHCFHDGIAAYNHLAGRVGQGSTGLWSVLLYCIVEARAWGTGMCKGVYENLCSQGDPSGHDFVNMTRCFVGQQDAQGLHELLTVVCSSGKFIDIYAFNRALAACGSFEGGIDVAETLANSGVCAEGLDAVSYNTLMKFNASAGRMSRCFELRDEMIAKGLKASEVTFGILLDACVAMKDLTSAKEVFDALCTSDVRMNVVHCTTFIKGFLSAGELDEAASVLREMAKSDVRPDLITFSTVVRAYADKGDVGCALKVLKEMIGEGIQPDDLIFNTVLTACSIFPMKSNQVMGILEALKELGMKPTITSLSILLKAFSLTQAWSVSLKLLKDAKESFGLEPEARLFVQLAQSCLRAHESKEVIPIFEVMLEALHRRGETVDTTFAGRLLRSCVLNSELEVAVQLRQMMTRVGIPVEAHIEKMLINATHKMANKSPLPPLMAKKQKRCTEGRRA